MSHTLLLISSRSPFVSVMGSTSGLVALVFFWDPSCYCSLCFLTRNGVLCPSSPPPPYTNYSSSPVSGERDLPLCSDTHFSYSTFSFVAHSFSIRAFSSASFFHCTANLCTTCFVASFRFFSTKLHVPLIKPAPTSNEVCQSAGQCLITSYMASSVTRYGRSNHFCCGSFRALM